MDTFLLPIQLRWADIDANFHVRHSVYYDWGAMCRMEFLRADGTYRNGISSIADRTHFILRRKPL
jgi:acyl-CoA thioesterase FadM